MKIAVALHGNLRTFLMPLRENPGMRVCDVFMNNIVRPNNADVFVSTDTTAFYHGGVEYFSSKKADVYHGEAFRVHDKAAMIESSKARTIIRQELSTVIGSNLRCARINDEVDVTNDEKFKALSAIDAQGASPTMVVQQYLKLKNVYEAIASFEQASKFKYDFIVKCRFDNMYLKPLNVGAFDFSNTDVYVPGIKGPMVLDWYGFGKRNAMEKYLTIYDNLATILPPGKMIIHECTRCGTVPECGSHEKPAGIPCPACGKTDRILTADITLSSEHHIYRTFLANNIRYRGAGYHVHVYRFRDTTDPRGITDAFSGINGFTLATHRNKSVELKEYK